MGIADNLKKTRIDAGMSQNKLSALTLIPASVISMYECGRRLPSVENLVKICKALKVSSDYLLNLDEQAPIRMDSYHTLERIRDLLNQSDNSQKEEGE